MPVFCGFGLPNRFWANDKIPSEGDYALKQVCSGKDFERTFYRVGGENIYHGKKNTENEAKGNFCEPQRTDDQIQTLNGI